VITIEKRLLTGIDYARLNLPIPLYDEGPVDVDQKIAEREATLPVISVTLIETGATDNNAVSESDTAKSIIA